MNFFEFENIVESFRWNGHVCATGKKTNEKILELFNTLDVIKPQPNTYKEDKDERKELWFCIPKDSFENYKEYYNFGKTEDDFEEDEWVELCDYTEEELKQMYDQIDDLCWYRIKTIKSHFGNNEDAYGGNWYGVFLNRNYALAINDSNAREQMYPLDLVEFVEDLIKCVSTSIEKVKDGTYNTWIEENLPNKLRDGKIKRKDYIKFHPEYDDSQNFSEDELSTLEMLCVKNTIANSLNQFAKGDKESKTSVTEIPTAHNYFKACKVAYESAGYVPKTKRMELIKKEAKKESEECRWYKCFADGRDVGLTWLDEDDEKAFVEWLDNHEFGGHPFEIITSMSISNSIHLFPMLDRYDGHFFLRLSGNSESKTTQVLKMYLGLLKAGFDVALDNLEELVKRIIGEDYLKVVASDYTSFSLSEKNVYLVEEEQAKKLEKYIEFEPLEKVETAN